MASIFAIDTVNKFPFVDEANFIRLAILRDNLEGEDEVLNRAKVLLYSIYDRNGAEIKKNARNMLKFLDAKYGNETVTRESLVRLTQIK